MRGTRRTLAVLAGAAIVTGATAEAASAKSLRLYTKTTASTGYHADGTPITDPNTQPVVGDVFATVDRVYKGTRRHHGKGIGYDHIVCTLATLPDATGAGGVGLCDASLYLPGGFLYIDRTKVPFTDSFTITVKGAGKFKRAKTLTQTAAGDNWSNLVIRY